MNTEEESVSRNLCKHKRKKVRFMATHSQIQFARKSTHPPFSSRMDDVTMKDKKDKKSVKMKTMSLKLTRIRIPKQENISKSPKLNSLQDEYVEGHSCARCIPVDRVIPFARTMVTHKRSFNVALDDGNSVGIDQVVSKVKHGTKKSSKKIRPKDVLAKKKERMKRRLLKQSSTGCSRKMSKTLKLKKRLNPSAIEMGNHVGMVSPQVECAASNNDANLAEKNNSSDELCQEVLSSKYSDTEYSLKLQETISKFSDNLAASDLEKSSNDEKSKKGKGPAVSRMTGCSSIGVQVESGIVVDKEVIESYISVKINEALYEMKEKMQDTMMQMQKIVEEKKKMGDILKEKIQMLKELRMANFNPTSENETAGTLSTDKVHTGNDKVQAGSGQRKVMHKEAESQTEFNCLQYVRGDSLAPYLRLRSTSPPADSQSDCNGEQKLDDKIQRFISNPESCARSRAMRPQVLHTVKKPDKTCLVSQCHNDTIGWDALGPQLQGIFNKISKINRVINLLPLKPALIKQKADLVHISLTHLLSHLPFPSRTSESSDESRGQVCIQAAFVFSWKLKELIKLLREVHYSKFAVILPPYFKAEVIQNDRIAYDTLKFTVGMIRNVTVRHSEALPRVDGFIPSDNSNSSANEKKFNRPLILQRTEKCGGSKDQISAGNSGGHNMYVQPYSKSKGESRLQGTSVSNFRHLNPTESRPSHQLLPKTVMSHTSISTSIVYAQPVVASTTTSFAKRASLVSTCYSQGGKGIALTSMKSANVSSQGSDILGNTSLPSHCPTNTTSCDFTNALLANATSHSIKNAVLMKTFCSSDTSPLTNSFVHAPSTPPTNVNAIQSLLAKTNLLSRSIANTSSCDSATKFSTTSCGFVSTPLVQVTSCGPPISLAKTPLYKHGSGQSALANTHFASTYLRDSTSAHLVPVTSCGTQITSNVLTSTSSICSTSVVLTSHARTSSSLSGSTSTFNAIVRDNTDTISSSTNTFVKENTLVQVTSCGPPISLAKTPLYKHDSGQSALANTHFASTYLRDSTSAHLVPVTSCGTQITSNVLTSTSSICSTSVVLTSHARTSSSLSGSTGTFNAIVRDNTDTISSSTNTETTTSSLLRTNSRYTNIQPSYSSSPNAFPHSASTQEYHNFIAPFYSFPSINSSPCASVSPVCTSSRLPITLTSTSGNPPPLSPLVTSCRSPIPSTASVVSPFSLGTQRTKKLVNSKFKLTKPIVKATVINEPSKCCNVTWSFPAEMERRVENYVIFFECANQTWKRIGVIKPLPLPMGITLNNMQENPKTKIAIQAIFRNGASSRNYIAEYD